MSEWKEIELGRIVNFYNGKKRPYIKGNIPVFGGNGILDYCNSFNSQGESIIIGRVGEYCGNVNYYSGFCWISDNAILVKIKEELKEELNVKYLYYYLISAKLREFQVGSSQPLITQEILKNIIILLPPLPEQKAIAEVLSSIDDKIELLHRQNKTLEEMAMTLFRQWFIEPTKDVLPEGWEEGSLGEIFDIGIGRTPPRKESQWFSVNQQDIRWISVKDLGSIDTYILNSSEFLKEEAVKEFNIPIIPDNTVVLSFKLTVGRIGITIGEMVSNEAIAHFKPKPDSKISSNYIYLFLKNLDYGTFGSTSSIAEAINSKIIKEIKIHVPDDELITSFQSLINPVFQKIRLNTLEIQTLEKLRDTLLPKLMNGEVRVKF